MSFLLAPFVLLLVAARALAFSATANDNVVVYWGQASAGSQESLSYYCQNDAVDVVVLSFMTEFFGSDDLPALNFASACTATFPGTSLLECAEIANDIATCQSLGKIVLLSLGGASGSYSLADDTQAAAFADTLWDLFLDGDSDTRPFGTTKIDGFDLDIESGDSTGYGTLVSTLRSHFESSDATKDYYISGAPQCPFPDASLGDALDSAWFDFVFVQFYNNYCSVSDPSQFNYDTWEDWASATSVNPNVRLFVGVPGSSSAAGSGYVVPSALAELVDSIENKANFGGIMIWDASQAFSNVVDSEMFVTSAKACLGGSGSGSEASSSSAASASTAAPTGWVTSTTTAATSTYEAPTSTYEAPTSTYEAPTSTYVAPSSTYVAPSSTYVAPSSTYVAPTTTYVAPTTTDVAPTSTYVAPSSTYVAPTTTYVAPTSTYAPPTTTDVVSSAPPSTYTAPTSTYVAPPAATSTYAAPTLSTAPVSTAATSTYVAPTLSTAPSTYVVPTTTLTTLYTSTASLTATPTTTASVQVSVPASASAAQATVAVAGASGCAGKVGVELAQCENAFFATLSASDACTSSAVACVGGQFAICDNGAWTLIGCPTDTVCAALPGTSDPDAAFITVTCDTQADVDFRLGLTSTVTKRKRDMSMHAHHTHRRRRARSAA
ncbi:endochitinase [Dipodascopsis tothii]|uniref:endochitinase n=1 Tax=Dipodascopsis tothii TaxID=44089 RepID=UPI0034CDFE7C